MCLQIEIILYVGLIEFNGYFKKIYNQYITTFLFTYSLLYFSETTNFLKNVTIYSRINDLSNSRDTKTGFFIQNFIKLIPLSDEKLIYCHNDYDNSPANTKIRCGLAQFQNNDIIINSSIDASKYVNSEFNRNYIKKNSFDGVKINDKEVILSYYIHEIERIDKQHNNFYDFFYYTKITIADNNKLQKETNYYNYSSSQQSDFYSLSLLKNSDDNLVSITVVKAQAQFKEYGYSTCEDTNIYLYNGDPIYIKFNLNSLFGNDIIFLNKNNQEIHSIFNESFSQPINYLVKYNKNNIRYNFIFCILPLSILSMFIVLMLFKLERCRIKEPLPNYGGNLVQSEMPLIQS